LYFQEKGKNTSLCWPGKLKKRLLSVCWNFSVFLFEKSHSKISYLLVSYSKGKWDSHRPSLSLYFFFITWDVQVSLLASRLISRSTEYLASPVNNKTPWGWQACIKRIEPEYREKKQISFPTRPQSQVQTFFLLINGVGWVIF
jgi:hypothetical protein